MGKGQIGLSPCPSVLLQVSVPFSELAYFSGGGNETKIQELFLQYLHADPLEKHQKFDSESMHTLVVLLDDRKRHHTALRRVIANIKPPEDEKEEISAPPLLANVLQVIVSKSILPITGADGPLVIAAYCLLAMGLPGTTELPRFLRDMVSPTQVSLTAARVLLDDDPQLNRDVEAINVSITSHIDAIVTTLPRISDLPPLLQEPAESARTDALMIYRDFLRKCLQTPLLPDDDANGDTMTIITCVESFYPQLSKYLCEDYLHTRTSESMIVPPEVRPLMVQMAEKSEKLWTRNLHYYVLPKNWQDEVISVTPSVIAQEKNRISLNDVIIAARREEVGARVLVQELVECHTYRYLTREENAARGIVTTPALSMNLVRETFHTADLLSMTLNAAGTIAANYPHESDPGELGNCKKEFAHSAVFTAGTFIVGCACKYACSFYTTYMASSESPKYVMDTVISSRVRPPRNILYDAVRLWCLIFMYFPLTYDACLSISYIIIQTQACKAHLYAIARNPDYFFGVRFVSDAFHIGNHTTCSWRYHSTLYRDKCRWNTQAAEQRNAQTERGAKSIRFMTLAHAVNRKYISNAINNADMRQKVAAAQARK